MPRPTFYIPSTTSISTDKQTTFPENDYCVTPLHVAAASNNSSVVEILASNGGLLEATTFYMLQTPLHYAARYNSPSSVKKLVEMGAVLEAR